MSFSKDRVAKYFVLWLLLLAPNYCWPGNFRLAVVLSNDLIAYQSFANILRQRLPETVQTTVIVTPDNLSDSPPVDLIVSVGMKASVSAIRQSKVPVLVVMVPRVSYEELIRKSVNSNNESLISAIFLDQPWERQFNFIKAALPKHTRIGMLYSDNSQIDVGKIKKQASKYNLTLVSKNVLPEENLYSVLDEVLAGSDVLLAVPDNTIYNNVEIRNILLSCYRSGIPFIGLSNAYVNAGAIGAIFSSQQQLADQIDESIRYFIQFGKLPIDNYSREFTISFNPEVARSLNINLPDANTVRGIMHNMNRGNQ